MIILRYILLSRFSEFYCKKNLLKFDLNIYDPSYGKFVLESILVEKFEGFLWISHASWRELKQVTPVNPRLTNSWVLVKLILTRFPKPEIKKFTYAICNMISGKEVEMRDKWCLTLILPRSRTGTVRFYTSTSNKRASRPKLYTKSLTRDLKLMYYSRLTLVRISINLQAPCVLYIGTGLSLLFRERFLYI